MQAMRAIIQDFLGKTRQIETLAKSLRAEIAPSSRSSEKRKLVEAMEDAATKALKNMCLAFDEFRMAEERLAQFNLRVRAEDTAAFEAQKTSHKSPGAVQ